MGLREVGPFGLSFVFLAECSGCSGMPTVQGYVDLSTL